MKLLRRNAKSRRRQVLVRAVATADDSNQKILEAEREKENWGATPEEEIFKAAKLEAVAHQAKLLRRIPTTVNKEKIPSFSCSLCFGFPDQRRSNRERENENQNFSGWQSPKVLRTTECEPSPQEGLAFPFLRALRVLRATLSSLRR